MKLENIKFKAKRLDSGDWVEGNLRTSKSGNAMIIPIEYSGVCPVEPTTICQFTGLKDYNGKEIWEGDLLTYRYFKDIYEVVWGEDDACFKIVNTRYRERTEPLGYSIRNIAWCVVGNKFDKEK